MAEKDLSKEREWLAENFDCKLLTVAAITAHLRIRANNAVSGQLLKTQAEFARDYVGLADSEEERKLLQQEVADILKVNLAQIAQVTDVTRRDSMQLLQKDVEVRKREQLDEALQKWDPVDFLRGGAHVNYDTEIKEKWRMAWMHFIEEQTTPERRARMKVLCLPGKKCALELRHYLALGFRPEHITAVEGGDRIARAEFELNARPLGIQYHKGRLEDFLPTQKTRYDVVSLDFTGQICDTYLKIASQLMLAERALMMTNTFARREAEDTQIGLQSMWDRMVTAAADNRYIEELYSKKSGSRSDMKQADWNIADARELCPMMNMAGIQRKENWSYRGQIERLPLLEGARNLHTANERKRLQKNIEIALVPLLKEIVSLLTRHNLVDANNWEQVQAMITTGDMFNDVLFGNKYITCLKKQTYDSPMGDQVCTFNTDMAVMYTPRQLYQELDGAVDFMLSCVSQAIHALKDSEQPQTIDRFKFDLMRGDQFVSRGDAKRTDKLVCLLDGSIIASKQAHILLNSAMRYSQFRTENPTYSLIHQGKTERMKIS